MRARNIVPLVCLALPVLLAVWPWGGLVSGQTNEGLEKYLQREPSGSMSFEDLGRMFNKMRATFLTGAPTIVDQFNNGTSRGINVLSGLVKVDTMREPDRPRGVSVRIFGIPVYTKGVNRGDVLPSDRGSSGRRTDSVPDLGAGDAEAGGGKEEGEEEVDELPLDV